MFGLIHYVETFPIEDLLKALISVLIDMMRDAEDWTKVILFRILNDENSRSILRKVLRQQREGTAGALRNFISKIADDEPDFKDKIREVLE
jgi:hypothetical protein